MFARIIIVTALVSGFSVESRAANSCSIFLKRILNSAVEATLDIIALPPTSSGQQSLAKHDAKIAKIEDWQISMIDGRLLGKSDTPPMYFIPEENVQAHFIEKSFGLKGLVTHISVTGLGPQGVIKGTLLLPVSGHNGIEDAKKWATSDDFDVVMQVGEGPNGDQFSSYTNPRPEFLIKKYRSTGLVTKVDVEIPLVAGKQVRLLYYRLGVESWSGAPDGYPEGRLLKISWDGK